MSNILISDLSPTGSALFADSESYLKELIDLEQIRGGILPTTNQQITDNASTYICSDCMSATNFPTVSIPPISW